MNDGTYRVSVVLQDRPLSGLHLCDGCATVVAKTFPAPAAMVVVSPTPWRGPCDLCRYTTTLSVLLDGAPYDSVSEAARVELDYATYCDSSESHSLDDGRVQREAFSSGWKAGRRHAIGS